MNLLKLINMPQEIKRSILSHLHHVGRYMRQQGEMGMGVEHLTMHQVQALFFVKKRQPVRMRDLAENLRISPGSTSLFSDRLVESGWLSRCQDKNDRRAVCLKLSLAAEKKLDRMFKERFERVGRMLDALSPKDQRELDRILGQLEDFASRNIAKARE
ncbi:MAG: MarR family transcriptional regulator [Patescibacteria group bacterium]|nr:MarR family transcriptional regulator [Patescibacteria group bacterium]